ncbi:hypothetical protein G5B38_03965 [Pseudohalocynthiibacter aestuariivivens]|nr:hypothetical protein [Pseudohalocynthiibacter aestuariivivens]QIE44749.1 hypothetical protein G5B38_03965 [Pseudohalocynthiibacter aestuariivivens]
MKLSETPQIKTRADGSIDTGYYMARGRHMRSEAAHRMMGRDMAESAPTKQNMRRGFFSRILA